MDFLRNSTSLLKQLFGNKNGITNLINLSLNLHVIIFNFDRKTVLGLPKPKKISCMVLSKCM